MTTKYNQFEFEIEVTGDVMDLSKKDLTMVGGKLTLRQAHGGTVTFEVNQLLGSFVEGMLAQIMREVHALGAKPTFSADAMQQHPDGTVTFIHPKGDV